MQPLQPRRDNPFQLYPLSEAAVAVWAPKLDALAPAVAAAPHKSAAKESIVGRRSPARSAAQNRRSDEPDTAGRTASSFALGPVGGTLRRVEKSVDPNNPGPDKIRSYLIL